MEVAEKKVVSNTENKFIKDENNKKEISVKNKKRDISIDLIRIFACITVICTHLCLQVLNGCYNRIDWSRLLEKSYLTDGVPLFFMITGFFLVNGRSYKKIWKSALKKILLPTILFILFAQIFYMFIVNKESFGWCLQNAIHNLNLQGIAHSFVTGNVTYINTLCAHLWYIFAHIKILIWIPILWLICKEEDTPKLARKIIIGFGILATIITDIQRFWTLPFGEMKIFQLVDREILYVLLGYEMFVHKDKIKNNKKLCIISLLGFLIINFIRYKVEMQYMVINYFTDIVGRPNFIEWRYNSLNVFSGLCVFMFLYSFDIKNEKLSKIILWISDKTFGIYLIHYLILAKIDLYKFEKIEKFVFEIAYLIIGLIVTSILSIIIIMILQKLKEVIVKLFCIIKTKIIKN